MKATFKFFGKLGKGLWNFFKTGRTKNSKTHDLTQPLENDVKGLRTKVHKKGADGDNSIQAEKNALKHICHAYLTTLIGQIKTSLVPVKARLKIVSQHIDKGVQPLIDVEKNKLLGALAEILGTIKSKYDAAKRAIHHLGIHLKEVEAKIQNSIGPSKKGFWDKNGPGIFIKALTTISEAAILTRVFELLGVNIFGAALLLSVAVSLILVFFAEGIANYYRSSWKAFMVWSFFGFSFLALLIGMRITADSEYWYYTAPMVFLLFVATVLLGIRRTKYSAHFSLINQRKFILSEIDRNHQIILVEDAKAKKIMADADIQAKITAENQMADYIEEQSVLQCKIDDGDIQTKEITAVITDFEVQKQGELDSAFETGQLSVYKGDDDNDTPFWRSASLWGLIAVVFFLTSCTEPKHIVVGFLDDSSGSIIEQNVANPKLVHSEISNHFKVNDMEYGGMSGQVIFTTIGNDILPKRNTVVLEEIAPLLLRDRGDADKIIKEFDAQLLKASEQLYTERTEESSTNIYFPLAKLANEIAKMKADNKLIYLQTDGVEQSSIVDFATYQEQPEKLLEDYHLIRDKMLGLVPMESLNGIKIILLHPDEGNGTLAFYSRVYWSKFLSEFGAEVTTKANI